MLVISLVIFQSVSKRSYLAFLKTDFNLQDKRITFLEIFVVSMHRDIIYFRETTERHWVSPVEYSDM